jgi:ABC-2 type transport system ATP-binding protein
LIDYRLKLGYVPQHPNLAQDLSVEEILIFAGRYFNMMPHAIKPRAQELMKQFDLAQYAQSRTEILSGGYKQRLLVARALMHNPSLIILDEPTVGMDPTIRRAFLKQIAHLKDDGISVLLTTHYLDEAEKLADRICIIDKGSLRASGKLAELKKEHNKTTLEELYFHFVDVKNIEN